MNDPFTLRTTGAEAHIVPYGGRICSYRLSDGFEILRTSRSAGDINSLEPSSYPLVPYSNRIKGGLLNFQGASYQLPLNFGDHPHSIHGVGWQSEWNVVTRAEHQIVLDLTYEGAGWPFAFYARQIFTLRGAVLRHEIEITNISGGPMPVGLGMHPYFLRHGDAVLTANVDNVWINDDTCLPIERVAVPDNWRLKDGKPVDALKCDNLFEPWKGAAQIHWLEERRSVELTASEGLNRLVVYAPEGASYFCVEPVSHITDAFNRSEEGMPPSESGMRILQKGESWSVWMQLEPN